MIILHFVNTAHADFRTDVPYLLILDYYQLTPGISVVSLQMGSNWIHRMFSFWKYTNTLLQQKI